MDTVRHGMAQARSFDLILWAMKLLVCLSSLAQWMDGWVYVSGRGRLLEHAVSISYYGYKVAVLGYYV